MPRDTLPVLSSFSPSPSPSFFHKRKKDEGEERTVAGFGLLTPPRRSVDPWENAGRLPIYFYFYFFEAFVNEAPRVV